MNVDFVAEVSSNHNRDLDRCFELIDTAAGIGCSAVKFQFFKINELFAPEILERSDEHRRRKKWELPAEFLPDLAEHCRHRDVEFGCTPFYLKAVEELCPYVDFYKISSYELLWHDLLAECGRTRKPVVLSTGMADLAEVKGAVKILRGAGCEDLTLLHCVSDYPTQPEICNLAAMRTLRKLKCRVGWSDHTVHPGVIYRAVHYWDAAMIEFHLDLDGHGAEYDIGHCWLPGPMQHLINVVKTGFVADGEETKIPVASELNDREWRADASDGLRPLEHVRSGFKR